MKNVIDRVDEILKRAGFFRKKATWNRKSDSFIDVIDIQKSKAGNAVTVNAGVLHSGVHMKCWGTKLPAIIQEPECIVRARIGQLVENKDIWWQLDDRKTVDEIIKKLTMYILPFLERMHSFTAMEQFLINAQVMKQKYPPPIIYLAILKNERGNLADACALLTELRKKTIGEWQAKIDEVAKRLACHESTRKVEAAVD